MTIFAVFFSYIANIKKYKENKIPILNKIFWYLSEIVLIVVSGIRYGVGQDYFYTYVPYFNNLLRGYRNMDVEVGFYWLNKIIQIFTHDYAWIFIVCSVIFFHFVYKAIREQSKYPTLSIFLLVGTTYIFTFYNVMRQMVSISIFLYSIKFIQNRNMKSFLVCMLFSCLIHYSSILLIPLYFCYNININQKKALIISLLSIALKPIVSKIMLYIIIFTKYSYYIGSKYDNGETGYVVMLINISVLIFSLIFINNSRKLNINEQKKYNFYVLLQIISTIIAIYDGVIPLIRRLRWATGFSVILLIPFAISMISNSKKRLSIFVIVIFLYCIYFGYTVGINNSNNVLPYKTIFEIDR